MAELAERISVDGVDYVRAYPVAGKRCPHCGGNWQQWRAGAILEALRRHGEQLGRTPIREDWRFGTPEHPVGSCAVRMFGSWSAALRAADLVPRLSSRTWTDEKMLGALVDHAVKYGRWPSLQKWTKASPEHPSSRWYRHRFGSWNGALRAAGAAQLRAPKRSGGGVILVPQSYRRMPLNGLANDIGRWVAEDSGRTLELLSERSGVAVRRIYSIMHGHQDRARVQTVDALLTAMNSLAWYDEFNVAAAEK